MPRKAREKYENGIYHIIIRSIGDVNLFRSSDDKEIYLRLIKKYQEIFLFKVYAYCIMNTHGHLMIDCCGADISKFMHCINQCYAMYFNKKYNRHGHVFQDRFKSKLVKNDSYLLNLSAYIHNNVKDISQYKERKDAYKYSSLGVYLGCFPDDKNILDTNYVLEHYSKDIIRARVLYRSFLNMREDYEIDTESDIITERSEYKSERKILIRNVKAEDIISFVEASTGISLNLHEKYGQENMELMSLCILIMRALCNFSYSQICLVLGNVTLSNVSLLCKKGLKLLNENIKYSTLIPEIIERHGTVLKTS